ncbi:pimeloyl-ACP methyl ester carboxylesterase [Arthrobacter sp. CAN_C5]|nr:pimeloyl-ACP methyl ester carboxylesterase [Arthrobacter sp. CAN_C5]
MRFGTSRAVRAAATRPGIRFVPTDAGLVRVRDSGGTGPVLLLVCDPPNVIEHYDAVVELLAPTHRVVCGELPGFGFSRPSRGFGFTLPEYESVTEQLLENLNLTRVTLAFPCVWGYVALRVAARRADLVEGLVLAQIPEWSQEVAWARRIDSTGIIRTPLIGQVLMAVVPSWVADRWYQTALPPGQSSEPFVEPVTTALRSGAVFCLASLTQAWFARPAPVLPVVTQPVRLLWGRADRSHRRSDPESLLPYLPHGRVVAYEGAGHFPELEHPDRLRQALTALGSI